MLQCIMDYTKKEEILKAVLDSDTHVPPLWYVSRILYNNNFCDILHQHTIPNIQ